MARFAVPTAMHKPGKTATVGLRGYLFVCFGLVAAVPVLILGISEARRWERVQHDEVNRGQTLIAESLTREIAQYVESHVQAVEALAGQVQALGSFDPELVKPILTAQKTRFGNFSFMYIAGRDGKSVMTEPAVNDRGESTAGTDYSDRDYYKQLMATKQTVISRVQMGKLTRVPNVQIASPIVDSFGAITGFAEGSVDLIGIREATGRIMRAAPGLRAVVTDHQGRVIAHPGPDYQTSMRDLSDLPLFHQAPGNGAAIRTEPDDRGVMMQAAVAGLQARDLQWTILVYRPTSIIQEQAAAASRHAVVIAVIALLVGLAFTTALVIALVRPVQRLVSAATAVGQGNFPDLPPLAGAWVPRETAALYAALSEMMRRVRFQTKELERRVADRTAQLTESNRELQVQSDYARRQTRHLEALYDASQLLHAESGTEELCRKLLDLTRRATDARYAAIRTFDDHGRIAAFFHAGLSPEEVASLTTPPTNIGVLGAISLANPAVRLDDLTRDPRHHGYPEAHPRMRTFLGVAISSGHRLLGKLYLTEKAGGLAFTEEDEALVTALARDAALAIDKAQLLEKVEALATTDHLTGLANRRVFTERLLEELERSRRYGHSLGLILADADDFKRINDTYGHSVGDTVLQGIAEVLRHTVREGDLCVRYGGEEFAVILPHVDRETALLVAERIREAVTTIPVVATTTPVKTMTISIGMAMSPTDGTTPDQFIRAADDALYRAKHNGKNRVETVAPLAA